MNTFRPRTVTQLGDLVGHILACGMNSWGLPRRRSAVSPGRSPRRRGLLDTATHPRAPLHWGTFTLPKLISYIAARRILRGKIGSTAATGGVLSAGRRVTELLGAFGRTHAAKIDTDAAVTSRRRGGYWRLPPNGRRLVSSHFHLNSEPFPAEFASCATFPIRVPVFESPRNAFEKITSHSSWEFVLFGFSCDYLKVRYKIAVIKHPN